jgi:uncharacterized membrane protein YeaQ/YmgE (transglycosylase-associated protein family)
MGALEANRADNAMFHKNRSQTFSTLERQSLLINSMLHIIWSILVGFVVGLIAHAFVPGAGPLGFWMTSIIGIIGSVVGGLIARIFSRPKDGAFFHPAGFFLSIIGAIIVLLIYVHLQTPAA